MTKEVFMNRYTWMRRCFMCDKISHVTRPVDFGIDDEDVCIRCIVQRKYKIKSRPYLEREEFLVFWMCLIGFGVPCVKIGIEWVFLSFGYQ